MEYLHPAMWHWFRQVTAPCNVACGSGIVTVNSPSGSTLQCGRWLLDDMPLNSLKCPPYWNFTSDFDFDHITAEYLHPAMWHWFRQMTAPCNVACGSGIVTVNSPSGSTLQYGRRLWDDMPLNSLKLCHIGILHLISISTTSLQSICYSAPVSEILSKSDHRQQKKMTSCRFSRWRISAILDFRDPIMGSLKSSTI